MRKIRIFNILHPAIFFLTAYIFFLLIFPFFLCYYFPFFETSNKTRLILVFYILVFLISAHIVSHYLFVKNFPRLVDIFPNIRMDLKYWKRAFYVFFIGGIFVYLYIYFVKIGTIPMFMDDLENSRVEAKKGIGKYILIGNALISVSLVYRFAIEKFVLNKIKKRSVFYLLIGMFFVMGIGFRGPAAYLLVACFLAYLFFSKGYLLRQGVSFKYVIFGLFFIIILSIIGYYRHTGKLSIHAIGSTSWTTAVNVGNLEKIIYNTDKSGRFYYGETFISDIGAVLSIHENGFTGSILKKKYKLDFPGEGMTITSPGEAYLNFGWFGVFVHAFLLGTIAGLFYEFVSRSGKLSWFILLGLLSLNFSRLAVGGIMGPGFFFLLPQLILSSFFIIISKLRIKL
ncbi:O-antigen polymerase [uncultured Aquimarina sp.]|uniref:O-antigen polymerase n=1 Tax=uncultured Aquimarina sp. TaxID=575652 RepID=UPI00260AA3B8|nr:O-antigen polymerase [uncultured Aquimarina sp.]